MGGWDTWSYTVGDRLLRRMAGIAEGYDVYDRGPLCGPSER